MSAISSSGCIAAEDDRRLLPDLDRAIGGQVYGTRLGEHLRNQAVSTIVFCGANFPNCPRTSIYEASERDFRIVLADDAISGLYDQGRQELLNIGVSLTSTPELVESLRDRSAISSG